MSYEDGVFFMDDIAINLETYTPDYPFTGAFAMLEEGRCLPGGHKLWVFFLFQSRVSVAY